MYDMKWIEGFTKTAAANGLDQAQAVELLKIAQRLHFINTNQEKFAEGFNAIEKQAVRIPGSVWASFARGMGQAGRGFKGLGKPLAQLATSPVGVAGAGAGIYELIRRLMGKQNLPSADPMEQTGKEMSDALQRAQTVQRFKNTALGGGGGTANTSSYYGGQVARPAGASMLF